MPRRFYAGAMAVAARLCEALPLRLLVITAFFSFHSLSSGADSFTLDRAWAIAEKSNPALRAARTALLAAEGERIDARGLLWNNPQLSTDLTRRRAYQTGLPNETFGEWNVGLSQTFEIAGQQDYRRQSTQHRLDAAQAYAAELRNDLRAEVELAFTRVLALQKRVEAEEQALQLVESATTAVRKRVAAGEDSRLDGNLASVEAERARNQLTVLREQLLRARTDLAAVMQLPPDELPTATGELSIPPPTFRLDELLEQAQRRPLLRNLDLREQAARSALALERASAYPDVTLGLTVGREGPSDFRETFTMLSVSVPLPLFKRNAAGVGRASTELAQAQIQKQALTRDMQAEVRLQWTRLESLRARVDRLERGVIPVLDENQRLSTISFRAGEIGLVQLLVVTRQLVDGRRDYLDAMSELVETRIALERTAGVFGGGATATEGSR
ncbi:MAG TPA: TolC family protein [Burkholderiales bacterium]|nr:TolC family protein [Burkholderiales bacterium]